MYPTQTPYTHHADTCRTHTHTQLQMVVAGSGSGHKGSTILGYMSQIKRGGSGCCFCPHRDGDILMGTLPSLSCDLG